MKTRSGLLLAVLLPVLPLTAQQARLSVPRIAERGPNHRVIQRVVEETQPDGKVTSRIASITELESGMHYWEDNEWKETRAEVEIVNGAALARRGPHKMIFDANLRSAGAIDVETSDHKRLRSHILGLAYLDAASGRSVMFAEVKDCEGAVLPPNQVWYLDAFEGDCVADVRFTYTKSGYEQDIVFRAAPPSPTQYGLAAETTRICVFSEFVEAPVPTAKRIVLREESDPVRRRQMAMPDLVDHELDFGATKFVAGQAFPLDDPDPLAGSSAPTAKLWQVIEGRTFLIEEVEYPAVEPSLRRLPQTAAVNKPREVIAPVEGKPMLARLVPAAPPLGPRGKWKNNQYASLDKSRPGFVVDYVALLASSLTNYTFRADSSYFIRGQVQLYETTVLEGGAVLKFTNGNATASLKINGPLDCRTDRYRPAFFTGKDDETVGESIPGSTGNPTTNYYGYYVDLSGNTNVIDLHDVRMRHGNYGVNMNSSSKLILRHAQIGRHYAGVVSGQSTWRNVLIHDTTFAIGSSGTNHTGEHVTFHRLTNLRSSSGASYNTRLTNSLLISVTNNVQYTGASVQTNLNDSGIFQTVGAGSHYLATNSPYRNAGTTNINPTLLSDLKKRTTYPPVTLSGYITTDTTLSPQAQRDTDQPDLGFEYDPLDFALVATVLTNATLTIQPGTAVATATPFSGSYGLVLETGAKIVSTGAPDNLNRIVRYNTVQEQATTNWSGYLGPSILLYNWAGPTPLAEAHFRFTDWSVPAQDVAHFTTSYALDMAGLDFTDCQFHGGRLFSLRPTMGATNCLFERTDLILDDDYGTFTMNPSFRHNLFFGGAQTLGHGGGGTWTFRDNLFAATTNLNQTGAITHDYNGYTINATRLIPTNVTDRVLSVTNISFDTGWLGRFYLPTNLTSHNPLFNSGSTNANYLTLYHYTSTTNQVKETNSFVDIGFHYVALGTNGLPADYDGEGLQDYYEDSNGDGFFNAGELDFQTSDTDYDGNTDYAEVVFGTAPLDPNSYFATPLAAWFFDNTNFFGFQGQKTTICTNVHCITTTTNPALQVHTNVMACIRYRDVEPNGTPNINCRNGSVRVWVKPNWSSTSLGGTGPGSAARILELGAESTGATNGQWALCLNSSGTELRFCTQGDGISTTNVSSSISWLNGQWHEVVLTYSPTNSALYVDGQISSTGSGVQHYPSATVRKASGLGIGADKDGFQQTKAQHDNLETHNFQLAAESIQADFASAEGVPTPCVFRFQASPELPFYTTVAAFAPEPATIGEQIRRSSLAVHTAGSAWKVPFGNCILPDWIPVPWAGSLQNMNWSATGGTPSSGTFAGPFDNSGLPTQPFTADLTVSGSGNIFFSGNALTGSPISGQGMSVFPATLSFVALPATRLGYWRLNGHWASDEGQLPSTLVGADNVTGWNGGALNLQTSGKLVYPASRSANTPNIKRNYGSVRFWFKPTWSSASAGGSGPGSAGRLLEMSGASAWSVRLTSDGNAIELLTTGSPHFNRTISWNAGTWHQIVVVYSRFASALYIDGAKVGADGTGVAYSDNAVSTFNIGSDTSGNNPAKGWFDELETFNYLLQSGDILANYNAAALLDTDYDGWTNLTEATNGTDPEDPDTDSDGIPDPQDAFPLDPTRSDPVPAQNPGDTTSPVIQLLEPINVVPQ